MVKFVEKPVQCPAFVGATGKLEKARFYYFLISGVQAKFNTLAGLNEGGGTTAPDTCLPTVKSLHNIADGEPRVKTACGLAENFSQRLKKRMNLLDSRQAKLGIFLPREYD